MKRIGKQTAENPSSRRLVEEADLTLPEGALTGATELRARQHAYNELPTSIDELVKEGFISPIK